MASPKALILQGILGVAGLCASSAGGVGLSLGKAFGEVQNDTPSADDSFPEAEALEDIKVEEDSDLGIPKECDTTCVLTAEQLKNLKFEARTSDSQITFEGLGDSDEFELTIEESEDQTNYPKGKKYTLKPKTISGQVTIKNIEEGDIVLGKDQEVLIREVIGGGKLEHLLEEVTELGIPKRCKADEVTGETSKTCELTQHQLQKLKFETRDGEKITVEGLNEGNLVTLKIEDKSSDEDNYPGGKKYTLTSNVYVLIGGVKGGDILLEKGKEFVIREKKEGGKLELLLDEIDRLGIPKKCKADEVSSTTKPCVMIQKQLKDLKFETKEGSQITVEGWSDISRFELTIEDKKGDRDNYPQGKKYKLEAITGTAKIRGVKGGDIDIWDGQSVVIRETEGGGKLERAPEEVDELGIPRSCTTGKTCSLTEYQVKNLKFEVGGEGITVDGIKRAKTVSLTVENKQDDTENYPKGKKYTLSSKRSAVTIKGLEWGDIVLGGDKEVVIREKENEKKLEIAPEEIDKLGIPRRCESGSTCQLTKEQLEKLKFETQDGSSISVEGLNDGNTVDLKVETPSDLTDYPKGKKYTLKAKTGTVTIRNTKDKNIVLEENKGVVFREKDGNKLETYLDVLGIPRKCGAEDIKRTSDTQTCYLSSDQLKDLKFKVFEEETEEVKVTGLTGKIALTISWDEDENTYPDNKKYSFDTTSKTEDITITKGGQEIRISNQKGSWFKNEDGQLSPVATKSKIEISREKKVRETNEILGKLGLGSLKIGDFVDSSSTEHKQTNVEFKNESDLKKIQFKDFMGGAEGVERLYNWSIKVYLEWDRDTSKFPKNMKFSFENPSFSTGYDFWRGNKTIKIFQKDSKTYNKKNTFKVEQQGDKWYLVRTNG